MRIIGLDLGGTKLAAALFTKTESGEVLLERALENRKYDVIFGAADSEKLASDEKSKLIESAMVDAVFELSSGLDDQPDAVGICSAGFVENGYIVEAWNTGMMNYPLRDRIAERTGIKTFLYKDSWAPVFALRPEKSSIIFSIGTGFGGVSCEPDLSIPVRSYTANRRLKWIPYLCCNDDPGYAVSFSTDLAAEIIERALRRVKEDRPEMDIPGAGVSAGDWALKLKEAAGKAKRLTPSKLELLLARALAAEAAGKMRPNEIFADYVGAAAFPGLVYSWLNGRSITPPELDVLLVESDPQAVTAFYVQAEFIGAILYRMQEERVRANLPQALGIFATGSGYNNITHETLSKPVVAAMKDFCRESGLDVPDVDSVEQIQTGGIQTTFACLGAATGAAMGIQ